MTDWLYRRPRLSVAVLLLLLVAPAASLTGLNFNNAPAVYLPESAPAVRFDRELRRQFPQDQILVALFKGTNLYSKDFLERFDRLARTLQHNPLVERALTVTTADHVEPTPDGFAVEPLISPSDAGRESAQALRRRVTGDRFVPGLLAARDGSALALVVRPRNSDDSLSRLQLENTVRAAIHSAGLETELRAVAGPLALDVAELRAMLHDNMTFIPATMVVGMLLLWILFRRAVVLGSALLVIGATVTGALCMFVVMGRPYTLVSSILPPLLSALAVAMLVHLFNAVRLAAARGLHGKTRVRKAVSDVWKPTLFTALTTAAGLLSLTLSPIRPVATLGFAAACGVVWLSVLCLVLLPPVVARWGDGEWPVPRTAVILARFTEAIGRLAIRRAGWVIAATVLVLLVCIPFVARVRVETDLYRFFGPNHPLTVATHRVEQTLSGVTALEVVFDAPQRDGLKKPARLRAIRRIESWIKAQPEVDYAFSFPDQIEEMNYAFHGGDQAYRRIPGSERLIAQYLFVYDGTDLYDIVDHDLRRTRLILNATVHGADEINQLMTRLRRHLQQADMAGMTWHIAGIGRLFADQVALLVQGQVRSLIAVTLLVFGLMALLWRSTRAAALCMVPNLAPVALIFALMGLLGIWLDMATAMIASIALGIAVDDTIHLYHGYSRRRLAGASHVSALGRTLHHNGRAVTATTTILCAQFLILGLSEFRPTQAFGVLSAAGLLAALLFDLMFLPAMLVLWGGLNQRRIRRRQHLAGRH